MIRRVATATARTYAPSFACNNGHAAPAAAASLLPSWSSSSYPRQWPSIASSNSIVATSPSTTTYHHHHQQQQQQQRRHHHRDRRHYSTFVPPPKNVYRGTPAHADVKISHDHDDPSSSSPAGPRSIAASSRNSDTMAVFVITGASRSMGLQFVRELMRRTRGRIVACVLRPGSTPDLDGYLHSLSDDERARIMVHRLDVTDVEQIEELAMEVERTYGRVDGLFNVAGVLGDRINTPGPEMNLNQMDAKWARDQMMVNAVGPMMMISKFAKLLRARKGKDGYHRSTGCRESVVVNISARVASMDDNNSGGLAWYTYRMSKAALNAGVRACSHELKRQGTWTICLYPGMTDTAMSRPFQNKALRDKGLVFPVDFAVGRLMDVVDGMEEEHSGGFYDWAGQSIPF